METFLLAFFLLILALILAVFFYIALQGDEDVRFLPEQKSALTCTYLDDQKAIFTLTLPYANFGKQEGIMLDAFARVLLPKEQFDLAKVVAHLEKEDQRRQDDYLEAFIVRIGAKGDFILSIELIAVQAEIKEVLAKLVDINIDIYYIMVGRSKPSIKKDSLTILLEEFQESASKGGAAI